MKTTILRFEKHKNFVNMRQAGAHQHRHHAFTPNADKCREHLNRTFIGSSNLVADVKKRLEVVSKKPRKNAVLAMDGVLTLSPSLFHTGTHKEQVATLKKFVVASKRWLITTFGSNVVNAVLHRDETSPHIHFTVVPAQQTPSGGYKLNARDMFNKETLHDFQRNYFESMKCHFPDLLPPKYKEKTTHKKLKEFYVGINQIEGIIGDFIDSEFHKQKSEICENMKESIEQHLEDWLMKIFSDVPENEKEEWVESIKEELEKKLEKLKVSSRVFNNSSVKIKQDIIFK
ncbi:MULTISPECIES: MobV family relaxase [Vibrio]|nr:MULTISPECIES: MobV family relaxase [Vibrio]MBS9913343.1 plasmid recombination protein [Vibrio alginolyticus]MDW3049469.1 MobV family relaxase [Vibrio sp. 1408]TPA10858.1 hypothetical protein DXE03_07480 [Vibrio parahaemolyticus]HCE2132454.1 plasmid recombination protein [Vibrio parahaemolyticus]HCE2134027.1 plasmid recombination protein [Vibrio parahaemolyticus]